MIPAPCAEPWPAVAVASGRGGAALAACRLKSIKSKSFRKHEASRLKMAAKKAAAKEGGAGDDEQEEQRKADFARAQERMLLTHRNTSRWRAPNAFPLPSTVAFAACRPEAASQIEQEPHQPACASCSCCACSAHVPPSRPARHCQLRPQSRHSHDSRAARWNGWQGAARNQKRHSAPARHARSHLRAAAHRRGHPPQGGGAPAQARRRQTNGQKPAPKPRLASAPNPASPHLQTPPRFCSKTRRHSTSAAVAPAKPSKQSLPRCCSGSLPRRSFLPISLANSDVALPLNQHSGAQLSMQKRRPRRTRLESSVLWGSARRGPTP